MEPDPVVLASAAARSRAPVTARKIDLRTAPPTRAEVSKKCAGETSAAPRLALTAEPGQRITRRWVGAEIVRAADG